ncbi:hypothetical protein ACFWEO_06485 [Streptomyces roseolus]|uniref:hypothetical protein n=2 Tax=Streptomyces TaxID=1883 RepID=UPI0036403D37
MSAWVGGSASAVSAWFKGGSWKPEWFGIVRTAVGCTPDACPSPYADVDVLLDRLVGAQRELMAPRARPVESPLPRARRAVPATARPQARPGQDEDRAAALRALDAVDQRTVSAWEAVVPLVDDPGRPAVHLRDVYVERRAHRVLTRGLKNQLLNRRAQIGAVLGEPGTGKSCVLWGVREELREAGWSVVAVSASALLAAPDRPADLTPAELQLGLEEKVRRAPARKPAGRVAFLLDTADLLLHDDKGPALVAAVLRGAREAGAAVAVACRSVEARRLEDHRQPGGTEALLAKQHLEGYDDGRASAGSGHQVGAPWEPGSELDQAVGTHLRAFCREPGRPGPRQGSGRLRTAAAGGGGGPVEPLAERMRSTLVYAAARGLPLGQLIRHPLSLRMLFDVYAPGGPRDKDIDVTDLFLEYWDARVVEDVRHAVGEEPAGEHARWDLSREVRVLGLAVLRAGKPELERKDATAVLMAHAGLKRGRAVQAVAVLLNRGVLRVGEGDRVAFHHQAFAEHAAGQALSRAPGGVAAVTRRVMVHPDDLLLAEAARHAFHIADRHGTADPSSALEDLMWHQHAATRLTALRIHAGLRHPSATTVSTAVETLGNADPWQTSSYMTVLSGTSNPGAAAWPHTLRAIWDREDRQDRRRVLIAVTHLAYQQPAEAASFLADLGLLDFDEQEDLGCLPVGPDLTLFLLGLHAADPGRCATALTRLLDAAVSFRDKPVLTHTLAALPHLAAEDSGRYGGHIARLPGLLGGLKGREWQASLDKLVPVAAPAWAAPLRTASVPRLEEIVGVVAEELTAGAALGPSLALRLRGLAETLADRPSRPVTRFLDLLAGAATTPESAEHLAKYLLAPLLSQETARPGVAASRDWCRAHLRVTETTDVERGAPGAIAKALDADKVPLPAETVAACLWRPRNPEGVFDDDLRHWLREPWPPSLTVAAAAGGHPVAVRALTLHVDTAPPESDAHAVRFREALGRRSADHPDRLLDPLWRDATDSGDLSGLKRLALLGPEMLTRALEDAGHRKTLIAIGRALQKAPAGFKAIGLRLEMLAATQGGLHPVTVDESLAWLTATRDGEVHKAVLKGVSGQLHQQAPLWRNQDPSARLDPVLRAVEERGREVRQTAGPPYGHHARQFMLAANEAYLLRIALHAHFDDLTTGSVDDVLAPLEELVFAELPVHLPPGDGEIALPAWRRRFEHLPHLCRRLAAAGHREAARALLDRVLDFTNQVHPSGKGSWRQRLADDWRSYLRVVSLEDRDRLTATILGLARRDVFFARQLVEVAAQCLGDISPELYALMRDETTPPALVPALRSTASWAGRAGHGGRWTEVFAEVR